MVLTKYFIIATGEETKILITVAIFVVGVYLLQFKTYPHNIFIQLSIEVFLVVLKASKISSIGEWTNKLWNIYIKEY